MTVHCIFRRADGIYEGGAAWTPPAHNDGTHIVLVLPHYPDKRTERWDGANGTRPATAQEITDSDEASNDATATGTLATPINIVLRDALWSMVQQLRALGQDSSIPELNLANAPNKSSFTAGLKTLVKDKQ